MHWNRLHKFSEDELRHGRTGAKQTGGGGALAKPSGAAGAQVGALAGAWRPRRRRAATSIGSLVPDITRAAFEKFGLASATLISDWPRIVGGELARYSAPERLKWPRRAESVADEGGEPGPEPGATLVLRVEGSRALEVQYAAHQIVERINGYFGYRAVGRLRIVQGPVKPGPPTTAGPAPVAAGVPGSEREADALGAALGRLQVARTAARTRRPG